MAIKNIKKDLEYYANLPYNIIVEMWNDGKGPYWVARIAELPHCLIHGDTPEEAIAEIEEVKRDWIKSNLERRLKIPEPIPHKHSGQISLRIPPSLHRLLSDRAAVEGVSLNQYMTAALAKSVGLDTTSNEPIVGQTRGDDVNCSIITVKGKINNRKAKS
ncbi:MAG: toxin-antitoxin system HicB family antitoxin [Dehalococcoidia bacterium]